MIKKGGILSEAGWDEAIAKAAGELKVFKKSEVAVIGSAYDTNEDNYLVQKFAAEVLGTKHIDFARHSVEDAADDILIHPDKTPNAFGAKAVGVRPRDGGLDFPGMIKAIKEGSIKALYVVDDNIAADPRVAETLSRLELLVVNFSFENETTRMADILLPSSTFAEKNGTFTNFQGRVQRIRPSVATQDQDRSLDGFAMSRLDKFGSQFDRWAKGTKRDALPTWKIIASIASLMGAKYKYATSEDVFNDLAAHVEMFKGMTYRTIGNRGMMVKQHEPAKVMA
jgi:predicted molibdopterin-dependent oxidoreductase YjgC